MRKDVASILKEWKDEAKVEGIIQINAFYDKTLKIYTNRPGPMIGLHGCLYEKYKTKLQEIMPTLKEIKFEETDRWYIK